MKSLFSARNLRLLATLIPLTILMGCGEGDGPARIQNEPAAPFAGPPASCFEALTFEDICDQVISFPDFEGGQARTVDNPDPGGINPSGKVVEMVKRRANSGLTFGGVVVDFSALASFEIPVGSSVTVKVWSQRPVNVLFEPDTQGQIQGAGEEVAHGGTGWEELTFILNASGSVTGRAITGWVFIFDRDTLGDANNDPVNWTFYVDDISLPMDGGGTATTLPVDFEDAGAPYTFSDFDGGVAQVIDNPDASGINTSAKVAQMEKFAGEVFGGSTLTLPGDIDFSAGEVFTMKVWASRQVPVLFKLEGLNQERAVDQSGSGGWEELCFDFSGSTAGPASSAITFIFDLGTAGDAANDAANWTFYFDDIQQVASCPTGGGSTATAVDFEDAGAPYTFSDFDGGVAQVIDNPDASGINTSAKVAQMEKFAGEVFGGSTLTLPGDIDFSAGEVFTMKVWASRQVPVLFKLEGLNQERAVDQSGSGGWEELCFDFSGSTAGPASSAITFIFDLGTAGDAANDAANWTFYFDDIQQVASCPTGGGGTSAAVDFESAGTGAGFTWNVFENGDNPPLEVITNPDQSGANTSATVAQFTARQAGQPFAGTVTSDLPTFTLDASNAIVKIMVWKPVISDVGIKFENGTGGSTGEIKVANTVTNQWEELTFDFSGVIGDPNNTDITGLVIFPDFNARAQDNVVYFDNISFSASGGGGGGGAAVNDFESGAATFSDFGGGVATVIANPDVSGINTSAQVGQMQKFAGETFGGSTLDLGGSVALAAGDSYTMLVRSSRSVVVTLKLEPLNVETTATHSGSGTWEELCFDFTGVSGDVTGLTLIFDNGTAGDAANDPDNWTFQFDDIQQTSSACPTGGGAALGPIDFEPNGQGEAFSWTVFENGDNPPLTVIDNPDQTGANTSGRVAQFTARQAGQPFAGTVTSDLPTFTLDASNAIVRIKVWKPEISDVGIKFENGAGGSTGEIKVANTVTNQWEELTFDFSGVIGDPNNTDITGLVIFPDFNARAQDNVVYFDEISFSAVGGGGGGGGGTATAVDFEDAGGPYTFSDFGGGAAQVIDNPDASGINTSPKVAQMEKFVGEVFGGSTLTLPAEIDFSAGEAFTMNVWASRLVPVLFKLEGLNQERSVNQSGSGAWEELCFDFTGSTAGPASSAITFIFDLGVNGDAAGDPNNWTFYFDDIQQVASCPGGGGGGGSAAVDFESAATGAGFTWSVFENVDNPPLEIIVNPDVTGANTSATVAKFTARQAGQPFAGTITSDLPTFTLDASNAIVKIKVWKSVISDVGIKFENGTAGSTGEIKVANTLTDQWEELTFDFSGVIGDPNNTDITGLIIFPDFDARTQENIVYFDDVSFSAVGGGG